jgi:hypothetical protein
LTCITSRASGDISTDMDVALASRALSTSSLTTEHGPESAEAELMALSVVWGRGAIGIPQMQLLNEDSNGGRSVSKPQGNPRATGNSNGNGISLFLNLKKVRSEGREYLD